MVGLGLTVMTRGSLVQFPDLKRTSGVTAAPSTRPDCKSGGLPLTSMMAVSIELADELTSFTIHSPCDKFCVSGTRLPEQSFDTSTLPAEISALGRMVILQFTTSPVQAV